MASFVRCWLIRGLIAAVLAGSGFGVWVVVNWVSPEKVRDAVVAHLREMMGDRVEVHVESAAVRVFGGIRVTNLTFTHRGEGTPFLSVPSAIISHDKQAFNRGRLSVRKVELTSPTLTLTRRKDGTWNVPALPKPETAHDQAAPTMVIRDGTVLLNDSDPDGLPPVVLKNLKLHVVNDPLPVLKAEGQCSALPAAALDDRGQFDPAGFVVPIGVTAKWDRATEKLSAHLEIPEIALRPELAVAFERVHPAAARLVSGLSGRVGLKFDLITVPGTPPNVEARVEFRDCRYEDAMLPKPLEGVSGTVRLAHGRIVAEKITGKLGTATAELQLETRPLFGPEPVQYGPRLRPLTALTQLRPAPGRPTEPREQIEDKLDRFEFVVRGLGLEDELVAKLMPDGTAWKKRFNPVGGIDVRVAFSRPEGGWRREVDVIPNRLAMTYEKFPLRVTDLDGWVKNVTASDGTDELRVQLAGKLGDRRVTVSGVVAGEGPEPHIALRIVGSDLPIDEKIIAALPPKYAAALSKLRAGGRGDCVVDVRQPLGVNRIETTVRVRVYDGRVNYQHFPYALSRIRGNVMVRVCDTDADRPQPVAANAGDDTDRVELRNFEAHHDGGRLWLSGESDAVVGTTDRKMTLRVQGENCPIDDSFRAGLTELKLDEALKTLAPRGEVTFGADVEIWDRSRREAELAAALPGVQPAAAKLPAEPPFNPATDLKIAFNFKGPTVTPSFFRYELNQLAGLLRYHHGRLELVKFSARHGASEVKLDAAEVRFGEGGSVWANVGGASVAPFVPDAALLKAMPEKVREGLQELNLRGGADLIVKHLVVKMSPPESRALARGQTAAGSGSSALVVTPPDVFPASAAAPGTVVYWNADLKLRSAAFDAGFSLDELTGTLSTEGRYDGDRLGSVTGTLWLDRALLAKQPVTAVRVPFRIPAQEPDPKRPGSYLPPVLEVRNLSAGIFQGTIGGQARVILADPMRYRVYLTAAGVNLEELARHYKLATGAELKGLAQGSFLVENRPDAKTGRLVRVGSGQVDVPQGRMYNLPVLLDLVKVLKGQQPDGCAFEQAHATFDLVGERLKVTQLDLLGSAVSLGGAGELDTEGRQVHFEFYTIWSQALKRWSPLGDVSGLISGSLFKIELTRENGKLTPKAVMVPVVTDPVRAVAERWRNRFGTPPPTVRAAPGR